ncbi:Multiphosphoryl transfer protein (Includes: Phosphocarrier protein HPr; Fructose-specific phosphotransferase enzyme IIA component) [Vibrio nigripulchritudo SOn1]|uniref:Multiphosphoryl transfer protein n=1 Tax=Vibrio nigripulchritudo SOn1 TaxID=1238450 RepID=A0AAV2VZA8_9VIBR|nr:fused PTS fructose transporter subunit IIA/HPr protein [Vibrio nigripulchritudo]CCO49739.1 Multiphosphoryl transfer protein (Includes: Phosphocarrier protein HPr; Fructose-specific phosphotransferase enzyme IIA component) [Vibrio nigripulchritudo SOn1]
MLTLDKSDITLNCSAENKQQAILLIGEALTEKGLVSSNYVEGMKVREAQASTFLGNGIAIPHGTTDTRTLVTKTGVSIHHFPNGVDWGEGNMVYLAIGIAAKSDEHLSILKQLTKVLSADGVEQRLKNAASQESIVQIINGESADHSVLTEASVLIDFPATEMMQLKAVSAGLINCHQQNQHAIASLISRTPAHLGKGLWLVSTNEQVEHTSVSFVSVSEPFEYEHQSVKAMIAFAAKDDAHLPYLTRLQQLIESNDVERLVNANKDDVMALMSSQQNQPSLPEQAADTNGVEGTFSIKNEHGLHARPGAMLVAEAKKFDATIKVTNLNGDGQSANAKSLMKVIALGVKRGHELKFTAQGEDAQQAIDAIGQAIASGLGEG